MLKKWPPVAGGRNVITGLTRPATENIKHGTPEAQIHERRRKIYDG